MPSLEPVTIATFPCNRKSIVSPSSFAYNRSGIAEVGFDVARTA
jgi:hypothetical protein